MGWQLATRTIPKVSFGNIYELLLRTTLILSSDKVPDELSI